MTALGLLPDEAQRGEERVSEAALPEVQPPFEGVRDAERRKGGLERRAPVLEGGDDDGDPLGRGAAANEPEDLVGDELEGPASSGAFEEAERSFERRRP